MNRIPAAPGSSRPIRMVISFDPPDFEDLNSLIRHVLELAKADGVQDKVIAQAALLEPNEFSMAKSGARPWQSKSIPGIIRSTMPHGLKIVYWFVFNHLTPEEEKVDRAADILEVFIQQALPKFEKAAATIVAAQRKGGGKK